MFSFIYFFFFFNDTATTEIYTLSLHDALPISWTWNGFKAPLAGDPVLCAGSIVAASRDGDVVRSEEHTSELQSRLHLVCRLLLEKKKKKLITSRNRMQDDNRHSTRKDVRQSFA